MLLRFVLFLVFLFLLLWLKSFWIVAVGFTALFFFNESQIILDKKVKESIKFLLGDLDNIINFMSKFCSHCIKEKNSVSAENRSHRFNAGNNKNCKAS